MRYKVILWCSDCTGEDDMGCFGGGTEVEGTYDTVAEAESAGILATKNSIWKFNVEAAND